MLNLNSLRRRLNEGLNYRLRDIAGGRFASRCVPTQALLLMSERCNARCIHCDIWKNRGKEDSPTFDQWSVFLADLRKWLGPIHVVFTGGEALLKPYTIDLLRIASSLGLYAELLTHGFWEDQEKIERAALARPARITISFDGVGATHSLIRGRDGFFDKTEKSIRTLIRVRRERHLAFAIRLKTVIMRQNLDDLRAVAQFAARQGLEVLYQPIEQNYNTSEDPEWYEHSDTWPVDTGKAIAAVEELRQLKLKGFPIANSFAQLEAIKPYFANPEASRIATQSHAAHEKRLVCSALTSLQIQANGDVKVCNSMPPVGNIKTGAIQQIWETRPHWWNEGCCLQRRLRKDEG